MVAVTTVTPITLVTSASPNTASMVLPRSSLRGNSRFKFRNISGYPLLQGVVAG